MERARAIVRPFVTALGFGAVTWGTIAGAVSWEAYLALVGPIVGWWFAERKQQKENHSG